VVDLVGAVVEGLVSFLGWVWGRARTAPSSSGGKQRWSGCCGGDCLFWAWGQPLLERGFIVVGLHQFCAPKIIQEQESGSTK